MKLLLAIDDSTYSEAAVSELSKRPLEPGSVVRVLNVIPVPFAAPAAAGAAPAMAFGEGSPNWPLGMLETRQHLTEAAEKLLDRAAGRIERPGVEVQTSMREGDARTEVVDEASEWGADLIVVGSHGYTGVKRLMLGSVAHFVVNHAPCSVEVVRKREAQ